MFLEINLNQVIVVDIFINFIISIVKYSDYVLNKDVYFYLIFFNVVKQVVYLLNDLILILILNFGLIVNVLIIYLIIRIHLVN